MLNLNLPARVWLPIHSESKKHLILRIPPQASVVLNSKDKVSFLLLCSLNNFMSENMGGNSIVAEELYYKDIKKFVFAKYISKNSSSYGGR